MTPDMLPPRMARKIIVADRCWLWQGAKLPKGYGRVGIGRSGTDLMHRVAYKLLVGPIPEGLELDHLCRIPSCCNPAHLEPVTTAENHARRRALRAAGVPTMAELQAAIERLPAPDAQPSRRAS